MLSEVRRARPCDTPSADAAGSVRSSRRIGSGSGRASSFNIYQLVGDRWVYSAAIQRKAAAEKGAPAVITAWQTSEIWGCKKEASSFSCRQITYDESKRGTR